MNSRRLYRRLRPIAGRLRRRLKEKLGKAGRVPDVSLEPTTLGPELDEAVLNAKRQMRIGADRDYDLAYVQDAWNGLSLLSSVTVSATRSTRR